MGKNNRHEWWIFFPFKGLDYKEKKDYFSDPIFGDATIVPIDKFLDKFAELNFEEDLVDRRQKEEYYLENFYIPGLKKKENFQSFIAIKRSEIIKENKRLVSDKLKRSAEERSIQISSFLAILFLNENKNAETCGLIEQIPRRQRAGIGIELNSRGFFRWGGSAGYSCAIFGERHNIKATRTSLKKTLDKNIYKNFAGIVLSQNSKCSDSLKKTVVQSALRVSDAIHAHLLASQLLGAVTAIEILLSNDYENYNLIIKRIASLLGNELFKEYDVEEIFKARHLFVHRGENVDNYKIVRKSLGLSMACLFHFCFYAYSFKNKLEFLDYLDFVNKGKKLNEHWSKKETKYFESLVALGRFKYETPNWVKS